MNINILYTCSRSRPQFFMDKSGSIKQSPTMKWYLNMIIERSASLRRCIPGGDGWKLMSLDLIFLWKMGEA